LFAKIPAQQWQTTNYKQFKQNVVDCQSHLTTENNLKVEKMCTISKTSTTFLLPERNPWGTRRNKLTKKLESNDYVGTWNSKAI